MSGYNILILIGHTGSGRTTLAATIAGRVEQSMRISMLEPAIKSICTVLNDDEDNYIDWNKKRSAATDTFTGIKSYQTLLADHMVALSVIHSADWLWAANLQARIEACCASDSVPRLFICDDVQMAAEVEWLADQKNANVMVVRCVGDPAKLAETSGAFVDELVNFDSDKVDVPAELEIDTEAQTPDQCAAFLVKKINERFKL